MKYNVKNGTWAEEDFMYVYSPIVKKYPRFITAEDCLINRYDSELGDYEYISVVTKSRYKRATLRVLCNFDKYGAPLVVFGNDIEEKLGVDGKPHLFYGVHFEVVAWEEGCNIWYIVPFPERKEHPVKPTKLLAASFKIDQGSLIDMTVTVEGNTVKAVINGNECCVSCPHIPESFHIGYTACEGINRLFSITAEGDLV